MDKIIKRLPFYYKILKTTAERSTCIRKQVASLIINPANGHILSMGYNGTPPGMPHCNDVSCIMHNGHCKGTIHAEVNALANLEKKYDYPLIMISTHQPCCECFKILLAFNISLVIFLKLYHDEIRNELVKAWDLYHVLKSFNELTSQIVMVSSDE